MRRAAFNLVKPHEKPGCSGRAAFFYCCGTLFAVYQRQKTPVRPDNFMRGLEKPAGGRTMISLSYSRSILVLLLAAAFSLCGCGDDDDGSGNQAGSSGSAGAAGQAGSDGEAGTAGLAGEGGSAGGLIPPGEGGSAGGLIPPGEGGSAGGLIPPGEGGSAGGMGPAGEGGSDGEAGASGEGGSAGGAAGSSGGTTAYGFDIRIPQWRLVQCDTPGLNMEEPDRDFLCTFDYDGVSGYIYSQSRLVSCVGPMGPFSFELEAAYLSIDGEVSVLQNAIYNAGGNHGNDSLEFDYQGQHLKYYHSSFGFGGRCCQNMDCIQVFAASGDETPTEDGCTVDRTLPVVCSEIQEDGSFEELQDNFLPCPGDPNYE
jgi:hypothetical protein